MATIRTFVGVQLSNHVNSRAMKLMRRLEATEAGYNWVIPENLHITLSFFGEIPDVEVPALCKELKTAVLNDPLVNGPFDLVLRGSGCFPNSETPRVIWLGIEQGAEELQSLNETVQGIMQELGIPKDRYDYNPHLTLGRLRRGGRWNQQLLDVLKSSAKYDCGGCLVEQVCVFSSHLDRGGPTYTVMSSIDL
ncbi:MAG: RNA 2',3'-cyclic phosphodiesterase [Planctomycetota bacterium]